MEAAVKGLEWTGLQKLLFKFLFAWVLIFTASFSFPHYLLPDIGACTSPFFERPVQWVGNKVLHLQKGYTSELVSDSTGLYIHALLVVFYAAIVTIVWTLIDRNRNTYPALLYLFYGFIRYYLALQLFTYGFSKLFKWQFYLPEPNTLFTTVGQTYKDLLYWTAMGSSRGYSIFLGTTEILAAALLLWRRTYAAGTLVALGIVINVLAVNLGFDISVKLYSFFLLLLSLILLSPFAKSLFQFLFLQRSSKLPLPRFHFKNSAQQKFFSAGKIILTGLILADALYPYIQSGNYNDDRARRPFLHGAYQVSIAGSDSSYHNPLGWKRVFVHRQGYFIAEDQQGSMQDYELQYDTAQKLLLLNDYGHGNRKLFLQYHLFNDSNLYLTGTWNTDTISIKVNRIDLQQLPLLQQEFNWTSDEPLDSSNKK